MTVQEAELFFGHDDLQRSIPLKGWQ